MLRHPDLEPGKVGDPPAAARGVEPRTEVEVALPSVVPTACLLYTSRCV
ncbi:hypothetical protein [Arthrobacter sp. KBS0703]|nr:hypothetical protein [Arthrobacter sp. KBS0703]